METKGLFTKDTVVDVLEGVFIYTENGNFISPKFWGIHEDHEKATCAAIVNNGTILLIHPQDIEEGDVQLLDWEKSQSGKMHESVKDGLTDFNGAGNTKSLAEAGSEVAKQVLDLPLLGKPWHIPTLGELQLMYDNKVMLGAALLIAGQAPLKDYWYWTSTRRSEKSNFAFYWGNGFWGSSNQYCNYRVRPVSALSLTI
ncbi:hypothetical protein [Bacteroides reticulotermitis]|uniref:DUF1566 domain-containing protein n=2 Tax=Bacteroides reticulotermitis TaxID=1133319 RepID=W4UQC0_9BACE|nr:hypothetical protein [Bacteroides reticulotermitis]MBB4043864.1 hypothetical protein [Bacteroides reticulotermitis]GAE83375.1 hypothetical protein JCM10512_1643 [Bacteroides reticulotermitis JCM 10512]